MTAALRLRMLPRFPSRITGTDGVKVVRSTGTPDVEVSLDFATLGDITGIPDPSQNYFAMYDAESGTYYRIPFQSMFDASGVSAGYPTKSAAELASIPVSIHAIYLFGDTEAGDGDGGLFIDVDNGNPETFVSGDGRTWYKAPDINTGRILDLAVTEPKLSVAVAAKLNGAMQKATYDPQNIAGDTFDRENWGDFDTQAEFAAKTIPAALTRVTVGTGKARHEKVRISTPSPVQPWHSQSADGAWWEISVPAIRPEMIAALGTDAQNQTTLDSATKYANAFGVPLEIASDMGIAGVAETRSGLTMNFAAGGLLRQTKPSIVGAFVTNVTLAPSTRAQTDIVLRNPQISGANYPDPVILEVASATTTTITFTSGASAVDDFYNGLMFQCMDGVLANASGTGLITDYVGSTRTATLAAALPSGPAAGVDIQVGFNDNAFGTAWGAKRVRVEGGNLRDYPMSKMTPPVLGGKGCNFEQGNDDVSIDGTTVTNCNTAVYISGHDGDLSTGASKRVVGARVQNVHGEFCGSYLSIGNLDLAAGIPPDVDQLQAVVNGGTYHNCGHAPLRIVGSSREKSGIINLMGANGATITNIRGYNDADYVAQAGGYPTDYAARCGYGLSGPIGAVVWGHARNTYLDQIHHGGNADAAIHTGRVRALGDDAPGNVSQMIGWHITNLNVYGTVGRIVSRDENLGTDASQFKDCFFQVTVDDVSDIFIPTQYTTGAGLILDITKRGDGTRIIGRAPDILLRGNTFAAYTAGRETNLLKGDYREFTIEDDAAISFSPIRINGNFEFRTGINLGNNIVRYEADASPQCTLYLTTANQATLTTALTGTTGTDGNLTISAASDGKIYVENRRGAPITISMNFLFTA